MAINPVDSGREFSKDGARCSQDYVIDLGLLLGESSVDWEGDGHVRAVVMERVTLVRQHRLPIDQRLVVVLVVQCRGRRSAPTDRKIRLHAPDVVILLAPVHEETLKLALAHAWLAVLHDVDVRLGCDLTRPAQSKQLLVILDHTRLA